jgi:hypothetical protein
VRTDDWWRQGRVREQRSLNTAATVERSGALFEHTAIASGGGAQIVRQYRSDTRTTTSTGSLQSRIVTTFNS